MADSTLAALTAADALGGAELLYAVQGGTDRKATPAQLKTYIAKGEITLVIDGGGAPISTGVLPVALEIPDACTITSARLLADQTGSIVVDIWNDTYANYPPTDADSITASAPPTISAASKSEDTSLTGWDTALAAGDILKFNVDSCSAITWCVLSLRLSK